MVVSSWMDPLLVQDLGNLWMMMKILNPSRRVITLSCSLCVCIQSCYSDEDSCRYLKWGYTLVHHGSGYLTGNSLGLFAFSIFTCKVPGVMYLVKTANRGRKQSPLSLIPTKQEIAVEEQGVAKGNESQVHKAFFFRGLIPASTPKCMGRNACIICRVCYAS